MNATTYRFTYPYRQLPLKLCWPKKTTVWKWVTMRNAGMGQPAQLATYPDRFSSPWLQPGARSAPRVHPSGARRPCFSPPTSSSSRALESGGWDPRSTAGRAPIGSPFPVGKVKELGYPPCLRGCISRLLLWNHFPCRRHSNPKIKIPSFLLRTLQSVPAPRGFISCAAAEYWLQLIFFLCPQFLLASVMRSLVLQPREAGCGMKWWHLMEDLPRLASGSCTGTSTPRRWPLAPRLRLLPSSSRSGSSCSTSDRTTTQKWVPRFYLSIQGKSCDVSNVTDVYYGLLVIRVEQLHFCPCWNSSGAEVDHSCAVYGACICLWICKYKLYMFRFFVSCYTANTRFAFDSKLCWGNFHC